MVRMPVYCTEPQQKMQDGLAVSSRGLESSSCSPVLVVLAENGRDFFGRLEPLFNDAKEEMFLNSS
jgi:hypothetical protein